MQMWMKSHVIFQLFESNNQIEKLEGYTTIEVDVKDVDIYDKVNINDEIVEDDDSVELDDEVVNHVVVKEWKESPTQFERQDQDFMNNIDTNDFFFCHEICYYVYSKVGINKIKFQGATNSL